MMLIQQQMPLSYEFVKQDVALFDGCEHYPEMQ